MSKSASSGVPLSSFKNVLTRFISGEAPQTVRRPHAVKQRPRGPRLLEDRPQRGVILHEIVQLPPRAEEIRTEQTLARRARVGDDAIGLDDQHDV